MPFTGPRLTGHELQKVTTDQRSWPPFFLRMVGSRKGTRPQTTRQDPSSAEGDAPGRGVHDVTGMAAQAYTGAASATSAAAAAAKKKSRRRAGSSQKRRCVSTACIACRRRKSKCDGALPSCAACASVHGTDCIYDPNSDHRRKGVYREFKAGSIKARGSTLQVLVAAILNASEDHVSSLVNKIRSCDDLDALAQTLVDQDSDEEAATPEERSEDHVDLMTVKGEDELARKMGELRFENGSVRFIGGTSHLIYLGGSQNDPIDCEPQSEPQSTSDDPVSSWTRVTNDSGLITHLINMYLTYHFTYFTALSKKLFLRDFLQGRTGVSSRDSTSHCSSLLVNAMLALGCHFTDVAGAFETPGDARTKGDHFFAEAKRLILDNDEFAKPRLVTVQALALMSVREAGCGREAKGWVYSGMSFRMAQDMGLNLEATGTDGEHMSDEEVEARRITYWGCFVFDKCWSNYLGRLPQLPRASCSTRRFEISSEEEDTATWSPLTDEGFDESSRRPSRTLSAALKLIALCEISSDLLVFFYHPNEIGRSRGKSIELKKLSEIHKRLEQWRKGLPEDFEPTDGQLPNVILMHMFFHLQYIHLFRPFLKYTQAASPLPSHVSPRRICTANAGAISKLMRLYKRLYGMRQICNIAVYMVHSACIVHLLNLPEKSARRDIVHGVRHLEEIAGDWPCARRTLSILSVLARKWGCGLPEDTALVLRRADEKFGYYNTSDVPSPASSQTTPGAVWDDSSSSSGGHVSTEPISQVNTDGVIRHGPRADGVTPMQSSQTPEAASPRVSYQQQQQQQPPGLDMPMDLDVNIMWARWLNDPASATAAASGYDLPSSLNQHASMIPQPGRQAVPGRLPTNPDQGVPNVQDWMLNDGARWQHNLDGWSMSDARGPSPEACIHGGKPDDDTHRAREAGQDGRGSVWFEGLTASLGRDGWLSLAWNESHVQGIGGT